MDFSEDFNEAQELNLALSKFESMLKTREEVFFDVEEIELVVDHFIENQNNNRAKKAIQVGCSQHPYSIDLRIKEAEVLLASGKNTLALDNLLKLASIETTNTEIHLLIAGIYSRQKNHFKALEYLERAHQMADAFEGDDIYFDLGLEYEQTGKFERALTIFKEILERNPDNDAAAYEILYCYSELERTQESVTFFLQFVDNNPYSFLGWYNLGICYSKNNDFTAAAKAFDYCTLIEPEVSLPYYQKAFMHLEVNNYHAALETYQDCLKTDENSAILYTYIGECYEKLEQYHDALAAYSKAVELDEKLPDAWLGIGVVYDLLERTDQALAYLKKAADLNLTGDYMLVYCEALVKSGELDEAEALYKTHKKQEEKNLSFWLDYSHMQAEKYGLDVALATLDEGATHLTHIEIQYRKAALLCKFGMQQEGALVLESCLAEAPEKWEEFTEYFPEGSNLALLMEFIDLPKNF